MLSSVAPGQSSSVLLSSTEATHTHGSVPNNDVEIPTNVDDGSLPCGQDSELAVVFAPAKEASPLATCLELESDDVYVPVQPACSNPQSSINTA
ncbi:hypothetical protein V6N13_081250 [Hibiscus sabdariffa]